MHEVSVSAALLEQVATVMERHHAIGVRKIILRLGPLSGVEPALLRAAYAQARVGTVAAHARLVIVQSPVRVLCEDCGAEGKGMPNRLICPACGSPNARLLGGDEMLLETVDLVY